MSKKEIQLSDKYKKNSEDKKRAINAVQIAFDLEQKVTQNVRVQAAINGITPSAQIRKTLGLKVDSVQRPRISVSLTEGDFRLLEKKFNLKNTSRVDIKKEIINFISKKYNKN